MRYQVVNLGCKVNRVESDSYEALLAACGSPVPSDADIVIVNTCTVTGEAEKKARKAVSRALRDHPQAHVLVTGCAAAIDPAEFAVLSSRISIIPKARMAADVAALCEGADAAAAGSIDERARWGVKVQDGCDNACTYCIVHVARGPARSIPYGDVRDRCRELIGSGIAEVVLTGINLGSYRTMWRGDEMRLGALLRALLRDTEGGGQRRFRISSIEPADVDDDLLEVLRAADGAVCRHLHLPLQAGSSRVLREMGRPYDAEGYMALASRIRAAIPSVSLTTDIIVGFPGETEDDFSETQALAERCGFSRIHVFPYSERQGTPAAARADQVPHEVRAERAARLRKLAGRLRADDLARRAGTVEDAVVEVRGRACTESYHEVAVSDGAPVGSMVRYRFGVQ